MPFLHSEEPVTDATVDCPECYARDWVVRRPRLAGDARIVCRACGHDAGPYLDPIRLPPPPDPQVAADEAREALARADFAVYAPEGVPWEIEAWFGGEDPSTFALAGGPPMLLVTSERADEATDAVEMLREELSYLMAEQLPEPSGRSHAAYLLEVGRQDERLEAELDELAVESATLRVDGADVACTVLRTGSLWAAHVALEGVAVTVASAGTPMGDVALVRARPTPAAPGAA